MVNEGKKVNWKRRRWLSSIGLMGLLLLFSQQNCAPASGIASGSSTAATTAPTDNQTIQLTDDGKASAALSFNTSSQVLTPGSSQNNVVGVCSAAQEGAILAWKVEPIEADGTLGTHVMDGFASCASSAFTVSLGSAAQLTCGSSYRLTAQLGVASPGLITITLPCN